MEGSQAAGVGSQAAGVGRRPAQVGKMAAGRMREGGREGE